MSTYSIKDLEHLSGIKAHTLRIWEQRYGLIQPKRSEGNIREYSDHELRLILNVSLLNKAGYKISRIAEMNEKQIEEAVATLLQEATAGDTLIDALVLSMNELNEVRFEKTFSTAILHQGFEQAMLTVVLPFLRRIGVMWQVGTITPAQEHFISNLIRQKMIVAIDGVVPATQPFSSRVVLYLPEDEMHEIPLLFIYYILKIRGYQVVYLGQSVPLQDLVSIVDYYKPEMLFSVFTSQPDQEIMPAHISLLQSKLSNVKCYLSGYQINAQNITSSKNIVVYNEMVDLINLLNRATRSN